MRLRCESAGLCGAEGDTDLSRLAGGQLGQVALDGTLGLGMLEAGVEFVTVPRDEDYGRVVVFRDIAGNRWDLLGPTAS